MYEVFIIVSFVYILCMVRVYCSACLVEVYTVISVLQKCNLLTMHVCTDLLLSNFQQRYTCIFLSYRHNTHTVLVTSLHSCISMYFSNKIVAVPMHVATTLYCTCMHASCCPISSLHTLFLSLLLQRTIIHHLLGGAAHSNQRGCRAIQNAHL